MRRMGFVQAYMADLIVLAVDKRDLVLGLQNRHALLHGEDIGRRIGRALVRRIEDVVTARGSFPHALHDFRRMRFEDRVREVADQRDGIAAAGGWGACILSDASQIAYRTGTRWWRLEIERVSPPWAPEVRYCRGIVGKSGKGDGD